MAACGEVFTQQRLPTSVHIGRVLKMNPRDPVFNSRNDFGYETTVTYKNGLPYPITVINRIGLATTIPPLQGNWPTHNHFTIYVRYRFAKNVKIDAHRLLDDVSETSTPELQALKEAITQAKSYQTENAYECVLSYQVTKQDLENRNGLLYVKNLDICLSTGHFNERPVHPESDEGITLRMQMETNHCSFIYQLTINDPRSLFGDRFINIGGIVYRVCARANPAKDEGVYRTAPDPETGNPVETFHTFDSADAELMLFKTADEAKTLGNLNEERKRQIEELHHHMKMELLTSEMAFKQKIFEMETQIHGYKVEKTVREAAAQEELARHKAKELLMENEAKIRDAKLAEEKALREAQLSRQKDYYEQRSYERKDSSEIIKWIPPMLVGLGLVVSKFL